MHSGARLVHPVTEAGIGAVLQMKLELIEHIEIALIEVKGVAQPNDIAELSSLLLDAREADSDEQCVAIRLQVDNLRKFCESRRMSSGVLPAIEVRSR